MKDYKPPVWLIIFGVLEFFGRIGFIITGWTIGFIVDSFLIGYEKGIGE